jgi:hypothetical protein
MSSEPGERTEPDVAALHEAWHDYHEVLRNKEAELSAALSRYTSGREDVPAALIEEVKLMRAECQQRFRAMMDAVQAKVDARRAAPGAR